MTQLNFFQEDATYVEGYENGPSVVNFNNGKREERTYEGGVLTGPAIVYGTDGDKFEFTYVEGKIQGNIRNLISMLKDLNAI